METVTARCPHCNATLAEGTSWCSLCFADLRAPEPEPEPTPVPTSEPTPERAGVQLTKGTHGEGPAYAPSAEDGTERPSAEEVEAVAARMLAELAAAQPNGGVRLPPALQTSGGRAAVMGAGALVVAVVAFALLALVGALV